MMLVFFFFQAEDGIRDVAVTGVQTCALPISARFLRKLDGKWVLPLQNTTQQPAQASLKNRAVRQRLFIASTTRAERGDSNDTRQIVKIGRASCRERV